MWGEDSIGHPGDFIFSGYLANDDDPLHCDLVSPIGILAFVKLLVFSINT